MERSAEITTTSTDLSVSHYLKTHFAEAQRKNKQYSLRAFSKKLNISPGGLSQILNRRVRLSLERAHQFAKLLALDSQQAESFLLLVQIESTKDPGIRAMLQDKLANLNPEENSDPNLAVDQFELISEWYGFAIKELVTSYGSKWSSTRIARSLGMTKNEVELTLERLERLAIIRKTPKGYQPVKARLLVQSLQFNSAQQKYYRSVLAKLNARIGVPEPPKVLATEVLSFNVEDLPEVRKITHRYLDRLIQISKKQKNPSQIYQSIVGFFPLEQDFT